MNQSRQTTSFPMHTDGKPRLTRSHPGMPIPRPGLAKLASGNAPYIAAFASVCLCAAGLIFRAGPWQLWVGLEFIFTAAIAFKSIPAAVGILILISPYNSIIRSVAGDGAFVRGFRDLLSYLIFAVFWLQCAGRVRNRTHSSIALLFVGWCVLVQIVNSHGLTASLLGVRQLVQFFLLFPIVVAVVSEQGRRCAANLLGVIVVTAGVMSLVQLANHFEYIHLPIAEGEGGSLLRNFQGRELVRMIPIVEISPSGLAIYMISASVIVIARIIETRRAPLLWIGCLAGPPGVCGAEPFAHLFRGNTRWLGRGGLLREETGTGIRDAGCSVCGFPADPVRKCLAYGKEHRRLQHGVYPWLEGRPELGIFPSLVWRRCQPWRVFGRVIGQ